MATSDSEVVSKWHFSRFDLKYLFWTHLNILITSILSFDRTSLRSEEQKKECLSSAYAAEIPKFHLIPGVEI